MKLCSCGSFPYSQQQQQQQIWHSLLSSGNRDQQQQQQHQQSVSGRAVREMGDFTFPYFYNYPPYFTLQPVKDTREKQIQLWKELILKYCKYHKCFLVDLEEEFPLFENTSIQRKLTFEARELFLGALITDGRAEWQDKNHRKCLILWRRIQDWADLLLDFVRENGIELMTLEEIISGDETLGTELAGIDRGVLIRAIKILEQRGRAAMFKGSSTDDDGVKFSPN